MNYGVNRLRKYTGKVKKRPTLYNDQGLAWKSNIWYSFVIKIPLS